MPRKPVAPVSRIGAAHAPPARVDAVPAPTAAGEGAAHRVVAAVDVHDLAGDPARER